MGDAGGRRRDARRPKAHVIATGMLIRISVESSQPLAGSAASDEAGPLYFDGWLEMLRVVSELVTPARSGGEDANRVEAAMPANADGDDDWRAGPDGTHHQTR
jgi:hypothetical protein